MEKRKINFLLYGESSFLNKGCEAIVNTTIKKIRTMCDGDIILSTNDLNDKNSYNDIITKFIKGYYKEDELSEEDKKKIEYYKKIPFEYTNFEKIYEKDCLKEIENVDICMSIGGDNYCYGEPNWLYTINKEIKRLNKRNVFWCTSLFEEIQSDEMIRDLKTYDIVVARETLTYNALRKYLSDENLILSPDTAFTLAKKEVELPSIFEQNKKVVGINISPLISNYTNNENNILESIKSLIDYILKETDYNIALIPHVYIKNNNDLDSLKIVKDLYKDEDRINILDEKIYDCEELKYIISNCSYIIAARTHASIAGYSSIVPTLVIGYSVKSKGIALDLFGNIENYVIPVDTITPKIILDRFKFLVNNEETIKNILREKVPKYQENSNNILNEILNRLDLLDKKYITSKFKCTGCMACINSCPNNAIEIIKNKEGFLCTKINEEKCTKCGLCKNNCPANKVYSAKYENPEFYAAFNLNEEDRKNSSSGGIVSLIAKNVFNKHGVVYGANFENKVLKHIRIESEKDLYKIIGSKYLQSEIGDILKVVKEDLDKGKQVLFTGTPCQIEGLKSYLNTEYENLICVSIICHGVPSPEVFKRYLEEKERKNNKQIKNVKFRNKSFGWHNYCISYENEKVEDIVPFTDDTYMNGFLSNYILRESCYNCQMKFNKKSRSDIILGDYWGIENVFPEMDNDKGVSAVIVNSKIGKIIFEEIKVNTEYKYTTLEDILKANPCLVTSANYTKYRDQFFELIKTNEIKTSIKALKYDELTQNISDNEITKLTNDINILNKQLKDLLEAKDYFLNQIKSKDKAIADLKLQGESLNEELQKIYESKRWRYTNKIANALKGLKS